ncbi:protein tyrosine phosphatase [Mucilaginibacter rubeus]|uniref:Protein tyrosine phosphatase n=1 Tax=Mucilaginibacter rubeus TaxID=2027860 RepID=A0AAE6JN87_9SPHI|nr:protein tyrosine phosphatase [Mucilaginibacter rubeus]QEM20860.1 protein tyrosine phosphatase [Mucilaginibacter gossypii]
MFVPSCIFICSKNQWRSPTAEALFRNLPLHKASSAGTSYKARVRVNQKMIDRADVIFVMEQKHKEILKQRFSITGKQLIGLLRNELNEYLLINRFKG